MNGKTTIGYARYPSRECSGKWSSRGLYKYAHFTMRWIVFHGSSTQVTGHQIVMARVGSYGRQALPRISTI